MDMSFTSSQDASAHFERLSPELRELIYAYLRAEHSTVYVHAHPVFEVDPSPAVPLAALITPGVGLSGVNRQFRSEYVHHCSAHFCRTQETPNIEVHVVDLDFTHLTAFLGHTTTQQQLRLNLTFTKNFVRNALDLTLLQTFLNAKAQLPLFAANPFAWRICQVGDCTKTLDPVDGLDDVLALNKALNDIDWADRSQLPPDLNALINASATFNKPLYVQNDPESYKIIDVCNDLTSLWWCISHVDNKHQLFDSGPPVEAMTPAVQEYLEEWHEVLMENRQGHGLPGSTAPLTFPAFPHDFMGGVAARDGGFAAAGTSAGASLGDRSGSEDTDVRPSEWDLQQSSERMEGEMHGQDAAVEADREESNMVKLEDADHGIKVEHCD